MSLQARTLDCSGCGHRPGLDEFLGGCRSYRWLLGVVSHACGRCGQIDEVQMRTGGIVFGRIDGASEAHYRPLASCLVPGLDAQEVDGGISVDFEQRSWFIGDAQAVSPSSVLT